MMVWHYTISDRAKSILDDGFIQPATAGVPTNEKPVVWFSANSMWEPTANKIAVFGDGTQRTLTTVEMFAQLGGELFRFGVDSKSDFVLPWHTLTRKARIAMKEQRRLISRAKHVSSYYMHWHGSLENVPVSKTRIQRFNPLNKEWEFYDASQNQAA